MEYPQFIGVCITIRTKRYVREEGEEKRAGGEESRSRRREEEGGVSKGPLTCNSS